jgi:hypothetical protein
MPETESETPLSRVELLRLAQSLGVSDADVMTRAELRAAIGTAQRPEPAPVDAYPITWVSVARRLVARVVERGLNLPDAAALIRGDTKLSTPPKAAPPVATVTLARIYAAQGHLDRAIVTLNEVLKSDPDHELARELCMQLELRREELRAANREGNASIESDLVPVVAPAPEAASAGAVAPVAELAITPEWVDSSPAELVAPSFDVIEREASAAPGSDPDATAGADRTEPPTSAFYTEPPTMVGAGMSFESLTPSAFPEAGFPDTAFPDTEPPATIAVGFDPPQAAESEPAAPEGDVAAPPSMEPPPLVEGLVPEPPPLVEPVIVVGAELAAAAPNGTESNGISRGAQAASTSGAPSVPLDPAANDVVNPTLQAGPGDIGPASEVPTAPPPVRLPTTPGLVLIETDSPTRYLYWEVAAAGLATRFWIHVVIHTPNPRGEAERRERRFPIFRQQGALRLEGLPARAVVRAKLTGDADESRTLAVAGAVKLASVSAAAFQSNDAPHAAARPEQAAGRAAPLLERASPVYWD